MGGEYTTQDSAHLVAGRYAVPNNPHEAVMNAQAAAEMGLHLGSVIQVGLNSDAQETVMSAPTGPSSLPAARVATVKMVGIVVLPQDVDENDYDSLGAAEVLFSPAETRQIATCCAYYSNSALKLVGGSAHLGSVESELNRLGLALPQVGGRPGTGDRGRRPCHQARLGRSRSVRRTGGPLTAVRRHSGHWPADAPACRRDGPVPRARRRPGHDDGRLCRGRHRCSLRRLHRGGAVAVALSPLFPLGPVRPVYPVSVAIDATVLGLGFAALVIVLSGVALLEAYRLDLRLRSRGGRVVRRPSAGTRLAAASGLPVAAVTGVRFAVDPGDRDPVPVRSAMLGATLAVVVVLSTVVFSASLNNLVTHPRLYGWNWDYALLSGFAGDEDLPAHQSASLLAHDHYVTAASGVYFSKAKIDGTSFPIIGASLHAAVAPPLLSGHGLQEPNQIVLGAETMALLGKHVGDTVDVSGGHGKSTRLTIVGTATLPALVGPGMGVGAIIDYRLIPPAVRNAQGNAVPGPNAYLIRTKGPPAQALRSLEEIIQHDQQPELAEPRFGREG